MKKRSREVKTVGIMLAVIAVIVLAYVIQDVYFSWSGDLRTDYLILSTEREIITADGIVIRDENRTEDGVGVSLLKMQADETYIPSVTDSTSVAAGDTIAYAFKSETQAQLYHEHMELEEKIEVLRSLQEQENLNYIDVVALNAEILSSVNDYMRMVDSGDLSALPQAVQTINYKLTTRQIADHETFLDFTVQIQQLEEEMLQIEKKMQAPRLVTTPYAGYFVSGADGYESVFDYSVLQKESVSPDQVASLLQSRPRDTQGAFGKIIGQHTWYFLCNVPTSQIGSLAKGRYVDVSFPEKGIYDVSMRVQGLSEHSGETVALVLKCTSMNESLATLRKERAEITINTYDGYKISSEALREEYGLTGIYVLSGKVVCFKPITILHDASSYVVAVSYRAPEPVKTDEPETDDALLPPETDGETTDESQQTPEYPKLETYDRVILKGKNLYDGKVIN